jgi:hypothetical protein
MSRETLAGMLDHELRRAIDRLVESRQQIDADITAIETEIERRRIRHGRRSIEGHRR